LILSPIQLFLSQYQPHIPSTTSFSVASLDNGTDSQDPSLAGIEANLDIQYTVGLALGVNITFLAVESELNDVSFENALLDTTNYLLGLGDDEIPGVLSTSYGNDEDRMEPGVARYVSYTHTTNAFSSQGRCLFAR
jgi:tripeptidyl-peptidase I